MKRYLSAHIGLVLCVAAGLWLAKLHIEAESFVIGGVISVLNIVLLGFAWFSIINKKLIALSTTLIVFKYAFLIVLIIKMLEQPGILFLWFFGGLGTLVPAAILYGLGEKCRST